MSVSPRLFYYPPPLSELLQRQYLHFWGASFKLNSHFYNLLCIGKIGHSFYCSLFNVMPYQERTADPPQDTVKEEPREKCQDKVEQSSSKGKRSSGNDGSSRKSSSTSTNSLAKLNELERPVSNVIDHMRHTPATTYMFLVWAAKGKARWWMSFRQG